MTWRNRFFGRIYARCCNSGVDHRWHENGVVQAKVEGVEIEVLIDRNELEAAIQSRTIVAAHWVAPILVEWHRRHRLTFFRRTVVTVIR